MVCRKIITGLKNYDIYELKNILDNYSYNKNDNNYKGIPIYKITDIEKINGESFEKYPKNINIAYYNFRNILKNCKEVIEVSNLGRIKVNNKLLEQKQEKHGYLYVNLFDNNLKYYVYRLVGETWCPCPVKITNKDWQVHHITNNGYDNRPENLIWVNTIEHRIIDPYPLKRNIIYKNSLFNKLDDIINNKNQSEMISEIFYDLVLLGGKRDKNKIEEYLKKLNIDLKPIQNILYNNIGIRI